MHLLTGRIAESGNGPFSAIGRRPGARGYDVAHRVPTDMVERNAEHRKHGEEIWHLPPRLLNGQPGFQAVQQDRMLKDAKLNWYWTRTTKMRRCAGGAVGSMK